MRLSDTTETSRTLIGLAASLPLTAVFVVFAYGAVALV